MPPKRNPAQLELNFEEPQPRQIPKKYDLELALDARKSRNARLGGLILNATNRGFFKIDKGLWIPSSKGEITAVVDSPQLTINKSRSIIYEKTHHKGYARRAANAARKKLETYYDDAYEQRWKLKQALLVSPEGYFTELTVSKSELALEALVRYVQDLNSFMERDWPQKRWKRYTANTIRAEKEIKNLFAIELLDLYNEAFWSVRSRMRYWHIRGLNSHEPPEVPPIPWDAEQPIESDYEE